MLAPGAAGAVGRCGLPRPAGAGARERSVVDVAVKVRASGRRGAAAAAHLRLSRDPSRSTPATVAPVRSHLLKVSWPFLTSAAALFP